MKQQVFILIDKKSRQVYSVYNSLCEAKEAFFDILDRSPWALDFIELREAELTF